MQASLQQPYITVPDTSLFQSFFMAGVECSSHIRHDGVRLDLIERTRHDEFVAQDYRRFRDQGLTTIRSGVRWHLIEPHTAQYDFSSVLPHLRAAREQGLQVIWDFCHYGYPDDVDLWHPDFVDRFAAYARALAQVMVTESDAVPFICPINEMSFFSWAGGDAGHLNPYEAGRSFELKVQLVRAAIAAMDAIWDVAPHARFVHTDPLVNIVPNPDHPEEWDEAAGYHYAQFQVWDMLNGDLWPILGGNPRYLDIVGVNYYPHNQWIYKGATLERSHPSYRPFHDLLREVSARYHRPLLIAETGAEGDERARWWRYVNAEVAATLADGVPITGICLYPIFDYPGWADDRDCPTGLWGHADDYGNRVLYEPLAMAMEQTRAVLEAM